MTAEEWMKIQWVRTAIGKLPREYILQKLREYQKPISPMMKRIINERLVTRPD